MARAVLTMPCAPGMWQLLLRNKLKIVFLIVIIILNFIPVIQM
jgi:hypothetical protein